MLAAARPVVPNPTGTRTPWCSACEKPFAWADARIDRGAAAKGSPPGPPRLHCPGCDAPVAQWHLDMVSDHAAWVWSHGQGAANLHAELPADPPDRWGRVPEPRRGGSGAGSS